MKGVEQRTVSSVSAADRPSGSKLQQLQLTMPTNIAQSFADDLIKEFDSRRSQLQLEMLQFQVQKLFLKRESEKFSVAWDDTFNGKALCNSDQNTITAFENTKTQPLVIISKRPLSVEYYLARFFYTSNISCTRIDVTGTNFITVKREKIF